MHNGKQLRRWVQARQMALMGYVTRIIILETGLTDKQVRRLYRDLEDDGYKLATNRTTRTIRSGATLLNSQLNRIHASLMMQLYINTGGEQVYTSVNIEALDRAFRMYQALIYEVSRIDPHISKAKFTISDAWCLASELRSEEAMFESCSTCHCSYFTSLNQSSSGSCPFCSEKALMHRGMTESAKLELEAKTKSPQPQQASGEKNIARVRLSVNMERSKAKETGTRTMKDEHPKILVN